MAHIVRFRSSVARIEQDGEAEPRSGAKVIIFPGVRRERHVEPAAGSQRREHVERDRLELPD